MAELRSLHPVCGRGRTAAGKPARSTPRGRGLPAALLAALVLLAVPVWGQSPLPGPPLGAAPGPERAEQPEQVVDVRVVGNRTIPRAEVLRSVRTRAGRPFSQDLVEEDVRRLNRTGDFVNVKTYTQPAPGGRVVIFEVFERPSIGYVRFAGNESIQTRTLKKQIDLNVGDALDPFALEEARAKLETFYQGRGYSKARVELYEGAKPSDRGVVFLIHEGLKQKILWVSFVGNTIASDARLRTQIKSKPPTAYLFGGELDPKELDADVKRLTAYYRGLGFFRARVGRYVNYEPNRKWHKVTFVIDEGPRFTVRSIAFGGNAKFSDGELAAGMALRAGQPFDQSDMQHDVATLQDKYGGVGYIFADVQPDSRIDDKSGTVDLVYNIVEGDRYRVGKIDVEIKGDYPHTKITTVLNRLSLKPGDIVDVRELRASERRLRASGLFLVDPAGGRSPKIVFSPPELDEAADEELAREPDTLPRGQSPAPHPPRGAWAPPPRPWTARRPAHGAGERVVNLRLQGEAAPGPVWNLPPEPPVHPMVVRGQNGYDPNTGAALPRVTPLWSQAGWVAGAACPPLEPGRGRQAAPGTHGRVPEARSSADPGRIGSSDAWAWERARAPNVYRGQIPAPGGSGIPSYAPATAPSAAPPSPAPRAVAPAPAYGSPVEPVPFVPPPGGEPTLVPPPGEGGLFRPGSPFLAGPGDAELTRPLPLRVVAEETQTGRLMFGVGINSDAGLVGSIVVDEQNFDWRRVPRSWADVRNATAFRGAGQRFRLEAVPGTEVQRYMVSFQEPYLAATNVSLGLSGFFYDRRYLEWDEQRIGGRVSLGYQFTHDLSGTFAFRGAKINIHDVIDPTLPELAEVEGDNSLYGFGFTLTHDTRDNAFLATEGHLLQLSFEQVIGSFEYARAEIEWRRYFLLHERPDGSGRHVLQLASRFAWTGDDTPIYDHYYAGGFSTIRGYDYRGASPRKNGIAVGGHFMLLNTVQYMFPITADDMLRAVVFLDTGTIEPEIDDWSDRYRVSPGFGLRITIPAMGPAPIALDFAFPIRGNAHDDEEVFAFFVGLNR